MQETVLCTGYTKQNLREVSSDSFNVGSYVSGLQQEGKTKIRVEPGLFEWTKWVSGTCLPTWIPPTELAAANLSVDTTYRYAAYILTVCVSFLH